MFKSRFVQALTWISGVTPEISIPAALSWLPHGSEDMIPYPLPPPASDAPALFSASFPCGGAHTRVRESLAFSFQSESMTKTELEGKPSRGEEEESAGCQN